MLNLDARKWGLMTTVTRPVHFGRVEEKLCTQFRDTVHIECGMIAETRPGAALRDLLATTCQFSERPGYADEWKLHHQGGAQGYRNRDHLMRLDSTETVIENQCFCWTPSIAGTKSEDAFIVKADGPLMITKATVFPTLTITCGGRECVGPSLLER